MPTSTTPRWIKVTLAISLAANLGIAGLVGGAMLRPMTIPTNHVGAPDGISFLARAMPQSHQRDLRSTLRDKQGELSHDRDSIRNLRDRFIASLSGDPFNIAEVNAVLSDQRDTLSGLTEEGHVAIVEQIESMSAADRTEYIENLRRPPRPPRTRDQN